MQEFDKELFNEDELEADFLEDCDTEIDEYDPEKAELNLKENKFRFVGNEGLGE